MFVFKWCMAFLGARKVTREPNQAHLCFSNVSSSQRWASTANTRNMKKVKFRSTVAMKVPLGSCQIGSTRHCGDPRHELEPSAVPQQVGTDRHGRAQCTPNKLVNLHHKAVSCIAFAAAMLLYRKADWQNAEHGHETVFLQLRRYIFPIPDSSYLVN